MLFLFEEILNCLVEQNFLLKKHKVLTKKLEEKFKAVHTQVTEQIENEIKSLTGESGIEIFEKLSTGSEGDEENLDTIDYDTEDESVNNDEFLNQADEHGIEVLEDGENHFDDIKDDMLEKGNANTTIMINLTACDSQHEVELQQSKFAAELTQVPQHDLESDECSETFSTHGALIEHCVSAHPEKSQQIFKCENCDAVYETRAHLRRHQKDNKHFPSTWFQCEFCPSKFQRKHHLKDHIRTHTGEKPHECDICLKRFSRNSALKSHLNVHKKELENNADNENIAVDEVDNDDNHLFNCKECSETFSSQDAIKEHYIIEHPNKSDKILESDESDPTYETPSQSRETWFHCEYCPSKFIRKQHLKDHINTHTGDKPYKCHICSKGFAQNSALKKHFDVHKNILDDKIQNHIPQRSYKYNCEDCTETFSSQVGLKAHHISVHPDKPHRIFKCEKCEVAYSTQKCLQRHKKKHLPETWFQCEFCSSKFQRKDELRGHIRTHTGDKPYKCHVCQKRFTQNSALKKHLIVHRKKQYNCEFCTDMFCSHETLREHHVSAHPDQSDKIFKCELCDAKFSCPAYVRRHRKKHFPETWVQCEYCSSRFYQKSHLKEHTRIHTGERPYECHLCPKKFAQSYTLKQHLNVHKVKGYNCGDCSGTFTSQAALQEHHANAHPDNSHKIFKCEKCDAAYTTREYLKRHQKKHFPETWLLCEFCPAKFQRRHHLKDHIRIHTGEKPYECHICPKKFTQNSSLKKHLLTHKSLSDKSSDSKNISPGEESNNQIPQEQDNLIYNCIDCPEILFGQQALQEHHVSAHPEKYKKKFKCDLCDSEYSNRGNLWMHRKKHFPETWLLCEHCPSKFLRKSYLDDHMRTHTGERPYNCHLCTKSFAQRNTLKKHVFCIHEKKGRKRPISEVDAKGEDSDEDEEEQYMENEEASDDDEEAEQDEVEETDSNDDE